MKKIIYLAWILSFHGNDYGSVINLLNSLPKHDAEHAQIFNCQDEDKNWAICVKYWQE